MEVWGNFWESDAGGGRWEGRVGDWPQLRRIHRDGKQNNSFSGANKFTKFYGKQNNSFMSHIPF